MSTDIEQKLRQLVGNAPISQTLEVLINDAHQFRVQTQNNLEQQYKEKKESLQRNSTPSSTMKKKIQKLTAVHAQEEQIIAALLLKICTHEIILARNKIIELTLSTEEHELALEKTTKNLERYKKQIESDISTLQFNEKFIGVEILNIKP